jgi:Ca2+-binding RTX toxin-like protein
MAVVVGTNSNDLIHLLGDGEPLPVGFLDVVGVTSGDDSVDAGAGNDAVFGRGGNDTLNGGTGRDTLAGGLGDDVYIIDNVADQVVELAGQGQDLVQASVSYTLMAEVENLTLTGSAVTGTGNTLANLIIGNAAANLLAGDAGNDTLDGAAGADTMQGGTGDDTYLVTSVLDVVSEAVAGGTDTVLSSVSLTLAAEVERLTLTGSAANGTGNALANLLIGTATANTLDGGLSQPNWRGAALIRFWPP